MLLKCVNTFVFLEGPPFSYDVLLHFVHLFARHSGGRLARDIRKDVFSIYGFGAGPGQSQESGTSARCPMCLAGGKILGPSSAAFQRAITRLWAQTGELGFEHTLQYEMWTSYMVAQPAIPQCLPLELSIISILQMWRLKLG